MSWFVILNVQDRAITPLVGDDEHENTYVRLFATHQQAHDAGVKNIVGMACGFEVFEWPHPIIREPS
jgi:hypothetical protein